MDRSAPRPPKPVIRPPVQRSYERKQVLRAQTPQRQSFDQNAVRSNGVTRQTLPPVQNAPVDQNYGRSQTGPVGADRNLSVQRPRTNGLQHPSDLWRDHRFETFRDAVLKLDGSGGSLILNNLVASALVDPGSMPVRADPEVLDLLRMVALYRMGRIKDLVNFIKTIPEGTRSHAVRIFQARALLASGHGKQACALAASFPVGDPDLSHDLLSETLMMTALCAARKKDLHPMGLIADLARDKGIRSPLSYAVIDYLVSGVKPAFRMPKKLGVRDYFFLRLTQLKVPRKILGMADPALLYALAFDRSTPSALRLDAAERAASKGQIDPMDLAAIYADVVARGSRRTKSGRTDAQTRALLFDGLSRTEAAQHRAKIIDTLLANTRGRHLSMVMGSMLAPYVAQMEPFGKLDWFAMRAVEVALLSGDMPLAERWYLFIKRAGRGAYAAAEWLPLTNLLQKGVVPSGDATQMAMRMARARRLDSRALHGLTSILDALSFEVPIPLWNEAGKLPQPSKGALPPTGALSQLKKASDEGRAGDVLLLSHRAVGTHSADQMHLIALGDIVRALKKAGFEKQAGQFGFHALYGIWPTGKKRQR